MKHYSWNDFMISAQLIAGKIVVVALPSNIRNLAIQSQGIQHIQKTFQGQINEQMLKAAIGEDRKQLRSISKFYEYLCECFNYTQEIRPGQEQSSRNQPKIEVFRQWCADQTTKSKKQRLIIKVFLENCLINDVKIQSSRAELTVKLKQVYLGLNSLLLKSNTIILSQLEYHKRKQQALQEKMISVYKELEEKMSQQLSKMKGQMQKFMQSIVGRDASETIDRRIKKKISTKEKERQIKMDQSDEETQMATKLESKIVRHSEQDEKIKVEGIYVKQEDEESNRLKILQEQQPKQKIIPIPIQFDHLNPSSHLFAISGKTVTKTGGYDYPMIMLKHIIPFQGTHGAIIKYVIEKKIKRCCCFQVGIIDEKAKNLQYSSVYDNYIKFRFNSKTVFTKVNNKETKKKIGKVRVLRPGESVEIRINLSLGIISWNMSYGQIVRAQIPKQLAAMKLQVFAGIFATGDMIEFVDYQQI